MRIIVAMSNGTVQQGCSQNMCHNPKDTAIINDDYMESMKPTNLHVKIRVKAGNSASTWS